MKTIAVMAVAAAFCLAWGSSSHADCGFYNDAQAQADCQREQLDRAREAREELEIIARDRRLMESLAPESRHDPYDLGRMFLDGRERNAIQDLDSALNR